MCVLCNNIQAVYKHWECMHVLCKNIQAMFKHAVHTVIDYAMLHEWDLLTCVVCMNCSDFNKMPPPPPPLIIRRLQHHLTCVSWPFFIFFRLHAWSCQMFLKLNSLTLFTLAKLRLVKSVHYILVDKCCASCCVILIANSYSGVNGA